MFLIPRVESSANTAIAAINPPKSAAASGLLHGTLEGGEGDAEDEDDDNAGTDVKPDSQLAKGKSAWTIVPEADSRR